MTSVRSKPRRKNGEETGARTRILDAAFAAFTKNGYAASSTLDIATRARVSKRELYTLVGNKQEMLVACITARAKRLQLPAGLPVPQDRQSLSRLLCGVGTQLIREVTDPAVIAVFRLAIAEAIHAPEVAQALDSIGRESSRAALRHIMVTAQSSGLIEGRPEELAEQFASLLWGLLMIDLLLGVAARPKAHELETRAREATTAFLRIHPATPTGSGVRVAA